MRARKRDSFHEDLFGETLSLSKAIKIAIHNNNNSCKSEKQNKTQEKENKSL